MSDFLMPKLGADMTAGKLVAWRKKLGDSIRRGDIVAEVDTDKGVIDVEAFSDGILDKFLVQAGESVPVGTILARIRSDGTASQTAEASSDAILPAGPTAKITEEPVGQVDTTSNAAPLVDANQHVRLRISPAARRRANELGIEPGLVHGTGLDGAITREDVERAAARAVDQTEARPESSPVATAQIIAATETVDRSLRMRQAIAAAMARSNREIPHYFLSTTIDMQKSMDWLARQNEQRKVSERLLYGVILLKAAAMALREVPELNAFWQDDRLLPQSSVHLGVAVSLRGGGLIAPALHNADRRSIDELMCDLRDLVQRVRVGKLRSSELSDPTITVTSLGERGVETVFGVIYPPQVALVGFGKVNERPWNVNGQIVARPLIMATLAGDHRASDGHRGGVYLSAVDRLLQEPDKL